MKKHLFRIQNYLEGYTKNLAKVCFQFMVVGPDETGLFFVKHLVRPLVILLMSDFRQTYSGLPDTQGSIPTDKLDTVATSQFKRKRLVTSFITQ